MGNSDSVAGFIVVNRNSQHIAQSNLSKFRRDCAMKVNAVRKWYIDEMEVMKDETMRKDEIKKDMWRGFIVVNRNSQHIAQSNLSKLHRDCAMKVKAVRKEYNDEMEVVKDETMRKDEIKKDMWRVEGEDREVAREEFRKNA
ncbi:hypothetical protein CTI12_AA163390 [Artemisia annua]|uniref:Uncharacterized protein n=1 Tax=Artemisia annua TaxID=35608 RepID=A0A2U1P1B1_ARTAN|nr:hypothetical protein CTI12_AA163390 [Artemisia annua]